ncbi:hypothetical protein [Neorhizobium alkalisoli]|uniref:hypothetical protein n=1 Tax=Neorhizobium alkalisoli TaxID=528178 RepID=UPI000CFA2523|nr:hypothetical protein [Neorhizobium alkalisoli]
MAVGKDQGFHRAWHARDNLHFNASRGLDQLPWTDPDFAMRGITVNSLTNVIKSGNPNAHNVPQPFPELDGTSITVATTADALMVLEPWSDTDSPTAITARNALC